MGVSPFCCICRLCMAVCAHVPPTLVLLPCLSVASGCRGLGKELQAKRTILESQLPSLGLKVLPAQVG